MIERKIAINTLYLFFRMILVMGVTLYTSRIVLVELGVVDFGIYNVVAGVVSMVSFLNTALANGYQRYFNIALGKSNYSDFQKYFSNALLIQIGVIFVTIFLCETLGIWFLNNKMTIPGDRLFAANWVFQTSILIFCFALIRVPFHAVIISFERMNVFAYLSVIEVVLQLALVYSLSLQNGDRLIAYGNLMAILSFCIMLSYIVFAKKACNSLKIAISGTKQTLKEMLSFSGWNLFGSLAHVLRTNGLNVLLNMFFSPVINAANGFASQISSAVTALAQNIMTASRPQVMKNYAQGDYPKMLEITFTISRYVFCLLWVASFPIILNIDFIYKLWLGDETPNYTQLFTILVLVSNLIEAFSSSLATLVHATGKMRNFQILVSLTIMSIIPISYIVLKMGSSPQSVFFINIVIAVIAQIVRIAIIKRLMPYFSIRIFFKDVLFRCAVLSLFSVLVIFPLSKYLMNSFNSWLLLFSSIILTVLITFIVGLDANERNAIVKQIKKLTI